MRHLTGFLILAALMAGCDSPTQPASAGTTTIPPDLLKVHEGEVLRQPISFVIEDACNGGTVTLTGQEFHVFNGVGPGAASGDFTNWEDFFRVSGTGIGENGTQYRFASSEHLIFESPSPSAPQVTFTFQRLERLVSKGAGANLIAHVFFHITVTPGGFEVVTTFDRAECQA